CCPAWCATARSTTAACAARSPEPGSLPPALAGKAEGRRRESGAVLFLDRAIAPPRRAAPGRVVAADAPARARGSAPGRTRPTRAAASRSCERRARAPAGVGCRGGPAVTAGRRVPRQAFAAGERGIATRLPVALLCPAGRSGVGRPAGDGSPGARPPAKHAPAPGGVAAAAPEPRARPRHAADAQGTPAGAAAFPPGPASPDSTARY